MDSNKVFLERQEVITISADQLLVCLLIIHHCLLQQDPLISDPEPAHYFAPGVPGPLSDFMVAGSEDEDHPGSGCSISEDGGLPPSTSSKQ